MELTQDFATWRVEISDEFSTGKMTYRSAVKKRGRLAAKVTRLLNQARDFTKKYEHEKPPSNSQTVTIIQNWLKHIDEALKKMIFFNEQVKGLFSEEERHGSNQDWVRTQS